MTCLPGSPQARQNTPTRMANGRQRNTSLDDEYMMYTYKIIPCSRVSTHNWKLCHFSHVGEVAARRRHPSCHQADLCAWISANKECPLGDSCSFAHNAFESWLHPARYKTTLCSYAGSCTRKFCFFAHSSSELRIPSKKQPELHLSTTPLLETISLETTSSIGTPNSSSSCSGSGILAQLQHPSWTTTTANPAVLSHAGGLYLANIDPNTSFYGANSSTTATATILPVVGAPAGLSAVVISAPPVPAAAGAPTLLPLTVPSLGLNNTGGVAQLGQGFSTYVDGANQGFSRLGTSIGTHCAPLSTAISSNGPVGHVMVDAGAGGGYPGSVTSYGTSGQTGNASLAASANSNSSLQQVTLSQSLDSSNRLNSNLQQQQQLLQHLAILQQQAAQQQTNLDLNNQIWAVGSHDVTTPEATSQDTILRCLNPAPQHHVGTIGGPNTITPVLSAAPGTAANWAPCVSMVPVYNADQQQNERSVGLPAGLQGTPNPASPALSDHAGSSQGGGSLNHAGDRGVLRFPSAQGDNGVHTDGLCSGRGAGFLAGAAADVTPLLQQIDMLSFAMAQPV